MTRTARLRFGYVVATVLLGVGTLFALRAAVRVSPYAVLGLFVYLVPGRATGSIYRDLYLGRALHEAGQSAAAIAPLERFLDEIRREPWRKVFVVFSFSVYTTDVEAMALNNLGAVHLEVGDFEAARANLDEAIARDPDYAIPHFNRAILLAVLGDPEEASAALCESSRLGYTRGNLETIAERAQVILARVEGHVLA